MKIARTALGSVVTAVAVLAMALPAMAEQLVPSGNSAVNQYTETYPTAGGQKEAGGGGHHAARHPAKVLGSRNTHRLDQQGPEGRAAAQLAAATAPGPSVETSSPGPAAGGHEGSSGGGTAGGGAGGEPQTGGNPSHDGGASSGERSATETGGSSGVGSVISAATGSSSSGQLGLLLPLLIVVAGGGALAYALRQRKRPTA